jgi:hypothetical protein
MKYPPLWIVLEIKEHSKIYLPISKDTNRARNSES